MLYNDTFIVSFGIIFIVLFVLFLKYIFRTRKIDGIKFNYDEAKLIKKIKKANNKDFEVKFLHDTKSYDKYHRSISSNDYELAVRKVIDMTKVTHYINTHTEYKINIKYDIFLREEEEIEIDSDTSRRVIKVYFIYKVIFLS